MTDEARTPGALGDVLGLHVRLAHGAIQRHFAETSGEVGLTQKQISVLWLVADWPGTEPSQPDIAQTDIAQALQMDRATTMTLVHSLEKLGLLERRKSAGDARRIGLRPTDAGLAALITARRAIAANEAWLHARFSTSEANVLAELLARIHR